MQYVSRPFAKITEALLSEELQRIEIAYEGLRWIKISRKYSLSTSGVMKIADRDVAVTGMVMVVSDDYNSAASLDAINTNAGLNTLFKIDRSGNGHNGTYLTHSGDQSAWIEHGRTVESGAGGATAANLWVSGTAANAPLKIHWLKGAAINLRLFSVDLAP